MISGPDHGFTGFSRTQESGTIDTDSGGLRTSVDSGYQVNGGSFGCDADETTAALFLGQNGRRANLEINDSGTEENAEAILSITRTLQPRGKEMFTVEVAIDGAIS